MLHPHHAEALASGRFHHAPGVDVSDALRAERFEAFDFGRERDLDPHLRLTGQWNFLRNLYVKAGYDDPLVEEFRSPFVGVGIRWSDEDLKYLMGSIPSF